jgi:predicted transcriptional regulator
MTITLTPELEERLKQAAARKGLPPDQYASNVLDEHLSQTELERREKLIALIQSWIDEEEASEEEYDEEFLKMLDEDRTSYRKLFPPELKGVSW